MTPVLRQGHLCIFKQWLLSRPWETLGTPIPRLLLCSLPEGDAPLPFHTRSSGWSRRPTKFPRCSPESRAAGSALVLLHYCPSAFPCQQAAQCRHSPWKTWPAITWSASQGTEWVTHAMLSPLVQTLPLPLPPLSATFQLSVSSYWSKGDLLCLPKGTTSPHINESL